ncbi:histamine H2 receptor-like [Paramacrobiotus metropolitanus]|uniref:histamine H2 receptor-like n=1 Tax=Paramacrobiotus metropolitanus TaxID=2943436 RepID=UPI00244600AC|nr:histamine H2 receptor-like [Paramacrobiotus metropolitanus]
MIPNITLPSGRCDCLSRSEITEERILAVAAVCLFGLLTVTVNLLLTFSIVPYKKLRSNVNLLLVSNAIADAGVGLYVIPTQMILWLVSECWPFSHLSCLFYYASKEHLIAVSVIHMMVIAIERYCRLLHNTSRFYRLCLQKWLPVTIIICWVYPSTTSYIRISLPYFAALYPYDEVTLDANPKDTCAAYSQQPCNCVSCFTTASFVVEAVLQYFLPMGIMVLAYGRIIFIAFSRLKKSNHLRERLQSDLSNRLSHTTSAGSGHKKVTRLKFFRTKEYRSIRLFLIILIAFLIPWGPHAVNRLMSAFGYSTMDSGLLDEALEAGQLASTSYSNLPYRTFRSYINLLGYLNSLVNPLLLFMFCKNFRTGFRATFFGCRFCEHADHKDVKFEEHNSKWNHYAQAITNAT